MLPRSASSCTTCWLTTPVRRRCVPTLTSCWHGSGSCGPLTCPVVEDGEEAATAAPSGRTRGRRGQSGDREGLTGWALRGPHPPACAGGDPRVLRVLPGDVWPAAGQSVPPGEGRRRRRTRECPPQSDAAVPATVPAGAVPAEGTQAGGARHSGHSVQRVVRRVALAS